MKITKVDADMVELEMATPYETAYESVARLRNLLVRIHTSGGITGFGIAAPEPAVTGESAEPAHRLIAEVVDPVLRGADPLRSAELSHRIARPLVAWPSVRCGVDAALFDILGKVAGLPLFKLLGGFREHIITSITIGIANEEETVRAAREHVRSGFHALKLKGGKDVAQDIARVVRVREAVGVDTALRFDANQGYSVADALRFLAGTQEVNIEIFEQPTPKRSLSMLGAVARQSNVPVMADESVMSAEDAFRIAENEAADMLNVKLTKLGGIRAAAAVASVGWAGGLRTMVGCMDECALGIAAGLSFACGDRTVRYADLDGHIGLRDDPTAGAVILKHGVLYPSPLPGLGLSSI